jgi:hypothetical protein
VIQGLIFLGVTILIDVVDFSEAFWSARRDPTWETRWRSLPPAESAWLAMMAGSRDWLATLTDPEEIALARGFRRHERRYRVYIDLAALPFMAAAGVLALGGLLGPGVLGLVAGAFLLVRGPILILRERQIKKTYERVKADYRQMTTADPASAG